MSAFIMDTMTDHDARSLTRYRIPLYKLALVQDGSVCAEDYDITYDHSRNV